MFCNDSMSYCDIDVDLLDEDKVKDAMEIVKQYGYNKIPIYCSDHLDTKLSELKEAWKTLYQNIDTNLGIIITKNKDGTIKWRLNYDSSKKFLALPYCCFLRKGQLQRLDQRILAFHRRGFVAYFFPNPLNQGSR